jgi:hypothetical protein
MQWRSYPVETRAGFPEHWMDELDVSSDLAASGAGVNRVSGEKLPAELSSALAAGVGRNVGQWWGNFEE